MVLTSLRRLTDSFLVDVLQLQSITRPKPSTWCMACFCTYIHSARPFIGNNRTFAFYKDKKQWEWSEISMKITVKTDHNKLNEVIEWVGAYGLLLFFALWVITAISRAEFSSYFAYMHHSTTMTNHNLNLECWSIDADTRQYILNRLCCLARPNPTLWAVLGLTAVLFQWPMRLWSILRALSTSCGCMSGMSCCIKLTNELRIISRVSQKLFNVFSRAL